MSKRKPARTIKARSASQIRSKAAGSGQPKGRANSKQARVLALLCGPSGATIATVTRSTGWQPHTVRAFLAAVVRKKLGLRLESEKTDGDAGHSAAGWPCGDVFSAGRRALRPRGRDVHGRGSQMDSFASVASPLSVDRGHGRICRRDRACRFPARRQQARFSEAKKELLSLLAL